MAQTQVPEKDLCEISVRVLVRISLFAHKYIIEVLIVSCESAVDVRIIIIKFY